MYVFATPSARHLLIYVGLYLLCTYLPTYLPSNMRSLYGSRGKWPTKLLLLRTAQEILRSRTRGKEERGKEEREENKDGFEKNGWSLSRALPSCFWHSPSKRSTSKHNTGVSISQRYFIHQGTYIHTGMWYV